MAGSLSRFLLSLDDYGHKQNLTYRGSETFPTMIGAGCTVVTRILTVLIFIFYFIELIEKAEPQIQSYRIPVPEEERIETGDVNLGEIDFYLGLGT